MTRPSSTYRAARRNACKELGYAWTTDWYHENHTKTPITYHPTRIIWLEQRTIRYLKRRLHSLKALRSSGHAQSAR
jgi:hypothetical protein